MATETSHAARVRAAAELAIIVVNWNGGTVIRSCLESLVAHPPRQSHEIVVVDNASTDGSREWLHSIRDQDARLHDRLRVHSLANGAANLFLMAVAFALRTIRGRPTADLRILLAMQWEFLRRKWQSRAPQ